MESLPKSVEHLVVDTNAFINGADIRAIGQNVYTIQEVIDEITCKKQLRHLSVLSYDLIIKDVFPENIKFVTEFAKKTGDYASLSAVDIKVVALTYQLEKVLVGSEHLNLTPLVQRGNVLGANPDGFFLSVDKNTPPNNDTEEVHDEVKDETKKDIPIDESHLENEEDFIDEEFQKKLESLDLNSDDPEIDILIPINNEGDTVVHSDYESEDETEESEEDDDGDWITVDNVAQMKKNNDGQYVDDEKCLVSCITADFAMQNILKQIGLNVSTYDGKLIRRVRTFILRCITCFKTTSVMTKKFCPKCGHSSLKKVSVTLDENGKQHIFINTKKPLTSRGKRFTLPMPKGGHHAQNPILNADDINPRHRPTKLARQKNNPLNPDYIAGFSPFVMRDVNSKSAVLGIRSQTDIKNWMRKNPNEVRKKRRK